MPVLFQKILDKVLFWAMHCLLLLVPLFDFHLKKEMKISQPSFTCNLHLRNWTMSNFLSCRLSSINGAIELHYDFEFISEFAMLTFPCIWKKKLHKRL